jgi:hypothetical protein
MKSVRDNFIPFFPTSSMVKYFMFRRPILCTLRITVDFYIVLYKGLYGWGVGDRDKVNSLFPAFSAGSPLIPHYLQTGFPRERGAVLQCAGTVRGTARNRGHVSGHTQLWAPKI